MVELTRKRVLITGGGGFFGSHVVDALKRHNVANLSAPRAREFDLTDRTATQRMFKELQPEIVLHLAARVGGIGANRRLPGTFFRDNLLMGVNVLEEARLAGTEKVVVAGTICAYPKFAPVPFREDDLWNGYPEETNAPYGIAKKALLVMAQAYRQEYGCNHVVIFPVNLYGPRDNFDLEDSHVIPAMIRKFIDARDRGDAEVTLWGDGSPTREFLYVRDAAEGFVLAAARYNDSRPVNLGAGFEISMRDLADKIASATRFAGTVRWDASRPNGQPRRMLDVSRARAEFGFEATTSFDQGLNETIGWYEENKARIASGELKGHGS